MLGGFLGGSVVVVVVGLVIVVIGFDGVGSICIFVVWIYLVGIKL